MIGNTLATSSRMRANKFVLLCLVMDVLWLTWEWFGKAEASAHFFTRLIGFHVGSCQLHGRSSHFCITRRLCADACAQMLQQVGCWGHSCSALTCLSPDCPHPWFPRHVILMLLPQDFLRLWHPLLAALRLLSFHCRWLAACSSSAPYRLGRSSPLDPGTLRILHTCA